MKRLLKTLPTSLSGLSAESAALILALGLTLGVFPVYGLPTLLCAVASLILGVNLPALQLVNQLATPLQLIMLVPFARLGARLGLRLGVQWFGSPHAGNLFTGIGASALHAVAGWFSIAVPLGILLYLAALWTLRRSARHFLQRPAIFPAG